MTPSIQTYIILLVAGLFLLGAEIFVPGGVIGTFGALALVAAMLVGFSAFGPSGGLLSTVVIILLSGIGIIVWIRFFPRTAVGKHLTLSRDGRDFKAPPPSLQELIGQTGKAVSALRPGGIALIGEHRVDVIAEGNWIAAGRPVRVVSVESNRVVVEEGPEPPA